MKVDLYTKLVLTVIAVSLATLALQNIGAVANAAQKNIQKVAICDPTNNLCARVATASRSDSGPVEVLLTVNYGD